jgi:hypothetical protein
MECALFFGSAGFQPAPYSGADAADVEGRAKGGLESLRVFSHGVVILGFGDGRRNKAAVCVGPGGGRTGMALRRTDRPCFGLWGGIAGSRSLLRA